MADHETPLQGDSSEWITPKFVIDALGPFDLDPCSNDPQPWPCAKTNWIFEDAGLMRPWFGRVWLNPPYGPDTLPWIRKLAEHGTGTALIFARTETAAFRWCWRNAEAILFLSKRLSFHRPDGTIEANGGAPSALIAFGEHDAGQLERSGLSGAFVYGWAFGTQPVRCESWA